MGAPFMKLNVCPPGQLSMWVFDSMLILFYSMVFKVALSSPKGLQM